MGFVAGVDGCKSGWFAIFLNPDAGKCEPGVFDSIRAILDSPCEPSVIAIDIPIGLLEIAQRGGRPCDRAARELLGQPRARSVFSPPVRKALAHAADFSAALRANRATSSEDIGISKQCHALFPKLREANSSKLGSRVYEVHPELCFYEMNKCQPMRHSKKAKNGAGIKERIKVLRETQFAEFLPKIMEN